MQSLRIFKDVKDLRDICTRLTWEMLEYIALIPLLAFCSVPLIYLILNLIPGMLWYYEMVIGVVMKLCFPLAMVVLLLSLFKAFYTPSGLRVYSKQNCITACCFLLFCLLMVVSTCVNGFTDYALYGLYPRGESLFTYLSYFGVFFLCGAAIRTPKLKRVVFRLFVVVTLIYGIAVLINTFAFSIDCLQRFWRGGFSAGFYQFNHYGYYLTISLLLSAGLIVWDPSKVWKVVGLASFLLQTVILQFNNTLGAFLASFLGLCFVLIVHRIVYRKFSKVSIVLLVVFLVLSAIVSLFTSELFQSLLLFGSDLSRLIRKKDEDGTAGTGRIRLWRFTLKKIAEKPLLGHGVDAFAEDLLEAAFNTRPHSEYLQYTAFFGIPAGICYLVGVFCVFLNGLFQKARMNPETLIALTAAFGYACSAAVGNTMFYTAPYFFIILGLGFTLPLAQSNETVRQTP